jgi:hypothetical protein
MAGAPKKLTLPGEDCIAAEPAIGSHDIHLGGLPPEFEDMGIAEQGARGREMRIGEGERRVGREAALSVRVAAGEEVHADRRVGIGARLDILRSGGGLGANKQGEQNEQPGRLAVRHWYELRRDCQHFRVWGRTMQPKEPSYATTQAACDSR